MPLLLPLNEQTPVASDTLIYFFPAYISADLLYQMNVPSLLSADVTVGEDSAALISADVEGAEGGALAVIDLVNERLR